MEAPEIGLVCSYVEKMHEAWNTESQINVLDRKILKLKKKPNYPSTREYIVRNGRVP
jgi:hypothetical protein